MSLKNELILPILTAIYCFGCLVIYFSLSSPIPIGDNQGFLNYSSLLLIAIAAALLTAIYFPVRALNYSTAFVILSFAILILVLFYGHNYNGAKRYINLAGLKFNASHIAIYLLLIYAAKISSKNTHDLSSYRVLFFFVLVASAGILMLKQPDFTRTIGMVVTIAFLVFLNQALRKKLFIALTLFFLALLIAVFFESYWFERFLSYQDPWIDPFNRGFQLTTSLMAIGAGDITGVGYNNGVWKHGYVPSYLTSFNYSVVVEELGVLGSSIFLLLPVSIALRCIWIGGQIKLKNSFLGNICLGIGFFFLLRITIHIGVCVGALPTVGQSFPILSFAETNVFFDLIALGLVWRISSDFHKRSRVWPQNAVVSIVIIIIVSLSLYIGRAWQISLDARIDNELSMRVDRTETTSRKEILDRYGNKIAFDQKGQVEVFLIFPRDNFHKIDDSTFEILAQISNTDKKSIIANIKDNFDKERIFIGIFPSRVSAWLDPFFFTNKIEKRVVRGGASLARLIGEKGNKGIEKHFEEYLSPSSFQIKRAADGSVLQKIHLTGSREDAIKLSIDSYLQKIVSEVLGFTNNHVQNNGFAILVEVNTGEIIAAPSAPFGFENFQAVLFNDQIKPTHQLIDPILRVDAMSFGHEKLATKGDNLANDRTLKNIYQKRISKTYLAPLSSNPLYGVSREKQTEEGSAQKKKIENSYEFYSLLEAYLTIANNGQYQPLKWLSSWDSRSGFNIPNKPNLSISESLALFGQSILESKTKSSLPRIELKYEDNPVGFAEGQIELLTDESPILMDASIVYFDEQNTGSRYMLFIGLTCKANDSCSKDQKSEQAILDVLIALEKYYD